MDAAIVRGAPETTRVMVRVAHRRGIGYRANAARDEDVFPHGVVGRLESVTTSFGDKELGAETEEVRERFVECSGFSLVYEPRRVVGDRVADLVCDDVKSAGEKVNHLPQGGEAFSGGETFTKEEDVPESAVLTEKCIEMKQRGDFVRHGKKL